MKIVVTGGCGFIGSNFVRHLADTRPHERVVVFDLLTYAGNLVNIQDLLGTGPVEFVRGDIADPVAVRRVIDRADAVVNFAAESHVDRSILDADPFIRTNVLGTHVLLQASRELGVGRFLQISTDEVYGSLGAEGKFTETTPIAPNSPYSASKAGADLLVRACHYTHGLPALILRSSNAYGPYQFPEKLIPLMILNALEGKPLPVYGDGMHVRDWIHVDDLCSAILAVLECGVPGEVYNAGGDGELPNRAVVERILADTGAPRRLMRFVPDRPGHDRRYAMDHAKITAQLGWRPRIDFDTGLASTIRWYQEHPDWVDSVRSGEYQRYYEEQYGDRLAWPMATPG
jgi:dTDP-glucose 4,6-dehydratase